MRVVTHWPALVEPIRSAGHDPVLITDTPDRDPVEELREQNVVVPLTINEIKHAKRGR